MSLRSFALPIVLAASPLAAQPETLLRIGLLRGHSVKQVVVTGATGACVVHADGHRIGEIARNDALRIDVTAGGLNAKGLNLSFKARECIVVAPKSMEGGFRMSAPGIKVPDRTVPGSLEVKVAGGALLLVGQVPLEPYVAGVVQSEAGNDQHPEYYKLQSVTCRTYALANQRKHLPEGFQLCDGVHCQVFHGRARHPAIAEATRATAGLVLVDADIRLIHATFHSNCGGETINAEDLWGKSEPYLRATTDPFCQEGEQATWERTLPRSEWLGYLQRVHRFNPQGEALAAVLNYEPACRDLYLGNVTPLIPLKQVRDDLKLRSTFFSVHSQGDQVVLRGRGFGHGVGLCQEGAMRMAKAGRSYTEILHHYYTNVHLVDRSMLEFFREEEAAPGPSAPKR